MMSAASEIVTALATAAAAVIACVVFLRGRRREDTAAARRDGVLISELGYIKSGIDDIKRKQENQDRQNLETVARLTAVEQSVKQAHKRLDALK